MDVIETGHGQASRPPTNPDWQLTCDTMMSRLSLLLFNEIMSDVTFIVGCQHVRIPAHKFILSIGSTVFKVMFYGMLPTENEVQIPDIEAPVFRNLLQYLYIDQVEIELDSVFTTFYTAKKYAVPGLERRCEEMLGTNLKPENAFLLLTQARFFDASHLVALCWDMVDKQTQACLDAQCFLDIDYDILKAVLLRDPLNVKEICLYEAVMRWSKAECKRHDLAVTSENQRLVLKDCIRLIRYPVMSNQEFAQEPAQNGLLTDQEVAHVFLSINSNPKPVCQFQDKPRRSIVTGSAIVCNRFDQNCDYIYYVYKHCHSIVFQVDQSIFVSGFGLFGPHYEENVPFQQWYPKIYLKRTNPDYNWASAQYSGYSTRMPYKVLFEKPVKISAHTDYTIGMTELDLDFKSFGAKNGRSKVTVECENGQKVTFQFFNDVAYGGGGTTVEQGQFPQIIFHL